MFSYFKALAAAKDIGLCDRGKVQFPKVEGLNRNCFHRFCNTRLRVGVDGHGNSYVYCWRCEQIVENSSGLIKTIKQQRLQKPKTDITEGSDHTNVIRLSISKTPTTPTAS